MTEHPALPRIPVAVSPLVGREGVLEPTCTLLRREGVRLVTLTGPGGVGKTRLAIAAAERLADDFPDGNWFIPLASLRDPVLVVPAIAQALGVREANGQSLSAALAGALQGTVLLVLDNLEQILGVAPDLAGLLARCPALTILATSRTVLRISGEWTMPVPPMALAGSQQRSVADLLDVESVRLFVERAQAATPDFELTDINAPAVVEICRRLDGLPLALELAASRLRHLPIDALLDRLEQRLPLLSGGPRDQPARLQTMRDAIAWSYRLLAPEEQTFFRNLSVFSGGFTIEAATAIAGDGGEHLTLDRLSGLVDSSLLRQVPGAVDRYQMMETIREFGLEQLREAGTIAVAHEQHAGWCTALVEAAWLAFAARVDQEPWLARIAAERDDFRSALTWLLERGDPRAVQISGGLFWFWFVRGDHSEGRRWLKQSLALPDADLVPPEHRARALLGDAVLAHFQGDDVAAETLAAEAQTLSRLAGFSFGEAAAPLTLGIIAEDRGDYREAVPHLEAALKASQQAGSLANAALARYHLGVVSWGLGRPVEAVAHWEAALEGQRKLGDHWGAANTLGRLGLVLALRGDHARSAALLQESLRIRYELGARDDIASGLANSAALAASANDHEVAARLFGAEAALRERIGSARKLPERAVFERAERTSAEGLGETAFATANAVGRAMALDEAVHAGLSVTPNASAAAPAEADDQARHPRLTARELEVLRLVAVGRTNKAIAGALFVSASTVRVHVSNILAKLEASTRTEAVDLARRWGLI